MDLNEALPRILKQHWALIVLVTALGLAAPAVVQSRQSHSYAASAHLLLGVADARSGQEANAVADTALGVVTSQGVVTAALKDAHLNRDPLVESSTDIAVAPVGTSAVLELTVTDASPTAAAALANALADRLVAVRRQTLTGQSQALLDDVRTRMQAAAQKVADVEAAVSRTGGLVQASALRPTPATISLQQTLTVLNLQQTEAVRQLSDLQAQFSRVTESLAAAPQPSVFDAATAPAAPLPDNLATSVALGGLLGLLLGVGFAAALESLRPRLRPRLLARHLDVPLLGQLPRAPELDDELRDHRLPEYLSMAADGAGVESVRLVAAGRRVDVSRLARWLATSWSGMGSVAALALPSVGSDVRHQGPADGRLSSGELPGRTGLVLVASDRTRIPQLVDVEQYRALSGIPLLGVVTYRHSHLWQRRPRQDTVALVPRQPAEPVQRATVPAP